jgi:multidrug efflux pump subunit AcrA (membrane-fusion protein)
VRQEDVPVVLPALGTVTPFATVTVRSQISGYLTSVAANEGRISHKGEFLQQIDARPYHASAEQIQGQLVRDQALRRTDAAAPLHVTALDSDSGERLAAGTLESIDNPPPPYDTTHRVTSCLSSPTPVQRTSARSPSASNGRIEP